MDTLISYDCNGGDVWQLSNVDVDDRILVVGKVEGRVTRGANVKQKLYALTLFISAGFIVAYSAVNTAKPM